MNVSFLEIVNLVIVVFLLFILTRKRDAATLLLVLCAYSTLHFSFSVFAFFSSDPSRCLVKLHREGGGMLAKFSVLALLGIVFFLLSRHAYAAFLLRHRSDRKLAFQIILVMVLVFLGYISNYRQGDWLQLKNVISFEAILAFLFVGFFGLITSPITTLNDQKIYLLSLAGLIVLGVTDVIAIYEIFYHQSWAHTMQSSGEMVYRASSILFNPNLLGFWASLVYLCFAYGVNACEKHSKMMLWGMVLATIAIYMSGSRTSGYLLMAVLLICMLLVKGKYRWYITVILPFTVATIYVFSKWFVVPFALNSEGWYEVVLLGERFTAAPLYLIKYILLALGFSASVPVEVAQSLDGRYLGMGMDPNIDSGWLVLYHDVGWFGVVAVIAACSMLVVHGVKVCIKYPNSFAVYALGMLIYCIVLGSVMRFQIFPVWMLVSIVITFCLVTWRTCMNITLDTKN